MDEFKSNGTWLVNIWKIVDQAVNIAVMLSHIHMNRKIWWKNWWPHILKVCVAILTTIFIQKQKWRPQRNLLFRSKMKWENSLQKKTPKTLNMPQGLLYVCTTTLILVINLFCFNNNCGLFCLCYITKHLMTAPSGNICFISLKSRCSRFLGNKTDVPEGAVIKCIMFC